MKKKNLIKLFATNLVLVLCSCGKNYDCVCTSISKGSSGLNNTIETVTTDRFRKKETARLMCENIKQMSTSPSATTQLTCVLK